MAGRVRRSAAASRSSAPSAPTPTRARSSSSPIAALATVDNVDQLSGQVALVFALGGAEGSFGVKETRRRLLPDLLAPGGPRLRRRRSGD